MDEFLRNPSWEARSEISKLKQACDEILEPFHGSAFGAGRSCGWDTVKRYANELAEMLRIAQT